MNINALHIWILAVAFFVTPYAFANLPSRQAGAETEIVTVCETCAISSLKEAIAIAAEGDTILVKKGTYKEYNIVVDKPLTIKGENFPIIDGEDQGEIIRVVADHVTIDGLFIINVGTSYTSDHAAIRVVRSENFLIQNVVLEKLLIFLTFLEILMCWLF